MAIKINDTNRVGINELNEYIQSLKDEVTTLTNTIDTLKTDVSTVQGDVTTLKTDVSSVQEDVTTLKGQTTIKSISTSSSSLVINGETTTNRKIYLGLLTYIIMNDNSEVDIYSSESDSAIYKIQAADCIIFCGQEPNRAWAKIAIYNLKTGAWTEYDYGDSGYYAKVISGTCEIDTLTQDKVITSVSSTKN